MNKKMLTILVLVMFLLVNLAASIPAEVGNTNTFIDGSSQKEEDCGCDISKEVNSGSSKRYYTGLLPSEDPLPRGEIFTGYTPPSWDWRNYNGKDWTTPIKDQGSCGSCYAFAPYASWESCYKIESNSPDLPIDLSEQYMVSCGSQGWGHGLIHGCIGGALEGAYYFMDEHGAIPESCFPYSSGGGSWPPCDNKNMCSNWPDLKTEIDWWGYVQQSQSTLKNAIIEKGPIVAGIYVYEDFFDYSGGIYKHTYGEYDSMHLLTVVGYNDDPGYWICKNSWGEDWGEPNPYDPNSQGGWCRFKYYECYFGFKAAFLDVHVEEYIERTWYGQDYTEIEGDVVHYDASHLPGGSDYAIRMAHHGSDATIYYEFDIGNNEVVEGMPIRVEYKDTGSGGGPSLYAYNWISNSWECLEENLGNQNKLKWIWVPTQNSNNYISASGLLRIKIYAESNDDTILDEVAVRYRYPKEDLICYGSIEWVNIPAYGTASGDFKVKNNGDPGTELDWEIESWPDWGGPWFFFPKNETGRKPEDGIKKVQINVQVPDDPGGEYFGVIKVVNKHDSNDWEVITIDLKIKKNKAVERANNPILQLLLRLLSFFESTNQYRFFNNLC